MGSRGRQGDPGGCREACLLVLEVFEGPSRLPLSPTRRPVPTHSWPPLPLSPSGPRPGRGPLLPPLPRLLAARSPRCLTMEPRSSPREPLLRTEPGEDYQAVAHADPRQVEKDYYRSLRSRRLFVAALAAVLGNFSFGFALVYPSPVIPALERSQVRSLQLSEAAASWFGVYISEISYPGIRGALGSCPQIMAVLGALTLYSLGLVLPWRWLAVAGEVPVLLMIILLCFMPDSPRFLISKRKDDEALSALTWLRGQDTDYQWEYEQIKDSVKEQSKPITWAELKTPYIYKPVGITLLMRFLQQLSGITPILVYLQLIFDSTAVILAPQYDAVLVGAVRLVSVIVAASSMDKAGRKILLYISAVIMFASSLTLGLYIHYVPLHRNTSTTAVNSSHESLVPHPANGLTILPLIATMFFIIGYAVGWGPITWLLMGEVLPLKARGMVSGLCVLVSWLTAFALTKAFLRVKEAFGLEVPFFFFSIICVINLIFTKWLIPETKGRSLERIESYFRTGRKSFLESLRRHR
ncbi:solute carrier family 2, facilitated glucose transporter member 6 isoform X2 [Sphaerodactylus townsendi]|uniref:solute carrier family 2, facilitated glucose transporter member 6 isoform X2 n=1 Tax=Sphaerodactylus townsendi TaxID=933632 RepID=UPI002026D9EA|nr:solute carrier family 2, facilitated glucose transporter member 6 isoform X2 [Sphaerodactylus townsendi]